MARLVCAVAALAVAMGIVSPAAGANLGKWIVGPAADVAAVRADAMTDHDVQVVGVHIVGDYAITQLTIGKYASGMWIYKRTSGHHWKRIEGGGGAPDMRIVPKSIAHELCSDWPKGYGC